MDENDAADLFQALANADRLVILRSLVVAGPEGLSAGDIATAVDASASRASFHLAALTEAGIIRRQRQSRSQRYSINFTRIGALITFLMRDCCKNSAELQSCCP